MFLVNIIKVLNPLGLARLPVLFVFLVASGCATNHVHLEFEKRLTETKKITGLIVHLESTGLELGGLKHQQIPEHEYPMFMAMMAMQQLFTEQQLQKMGVTPTLYLPEELVGLGYEESVARRHIDLLTGLLVSAIRNPARPVRWDELEAVRQLAVLGGGDIVLLGEIRTSHHMSEKSRSFANFLSIRAASCGQYGVVDGKDTATSKWVIINPADGNVLRALEDTLRY